MENISENVPSAKKNIAKNVSHPAKIVTKLGV